MVNLAIQNLVNAINANHDFKVIPLIDSRYIGDQLLSVVKPCGHEEQIGTIRIEGPTIVENLDFCFHYSLDEVDLIHNFIKKYADENEMEFVSNRIYAWEKPALNFKTLGGEEPCGKETIKKNKFIEKLKNLFAK